MTKRWLAGFCVAIVVAASCPAHAATAVPVDGAVTDPRAALRVDDWVLSVSNLDALLRAARMQKPDVTRMQVAAAVAEDRVLGGYAEREYGDVRLLVGERVRFSARASEAASLAATLEAAFREPLSKAAGQGESYIVKRHSLSRDHLAALLDTGNKLRLDDRLPPAREAKLKQVVLLDARVGSEPYRVTLHDVWTTLDVQGRNALYRGDTGFAMQQAGQVARERFVLGWARQSSGLGAAGVAQLRQLVADRNRRNALARLLGSGSDPHYSSPEVVRLQRTIEPAAIRAYYNSHTSEFSRTEKVLARTLRFTDEAKARAAADALARGADFEDVARRHGGGDGVARWIGIDAARRAWVAQFAFAQTPDAASAPVREPESGAAAGWVIVKVEQRVTGFHPVDSETVRFAASEAIARRRAATNFATLRARLLAAARVNVNPRALGVVATPAKLEPGQ